MSLSVLCLLSSEPWVTMQCVIVVFPDHTLSLCHLFHLKLRVRRQQIQKTTELYCLHSVYTSYLSKPTKLMFSTVYGGEVQCQVLLYNPLRTGVFYEL